MEVWDGWFESALRRHVITSMGMICRRSPDMRRPTPLHRWHVAAAARPSSTAGPGRTHLPAGASVGMSVEPDIRADCVAALKLLDLSQNLLCPGCAGRHVNGQKLGSEEWL